MSGWDSRGWCCQRPYWSRMKLHRSRIGGQASRSQSKMGMKMLRKLAVCVAVFTVVGAASALADRKPGSSEFFEYCSGCHSMYCNRTGPKLVGIVGRRAGSIANFKHYSDAIKGSDIVWTLEKIDELLRKPQAVVPGGAMPSDGKFLRASAAERRMILRFLQDPDRSAEVCP